MMICSSGYPWAYLGGVYRFKPHKISHINVGKYEQIQFKTVKSKNSRIFSGYVARKPRKKPWGGRGVGWRTYVPYIQSKILSCNVPSKLCACARAHRP